MKYTTSLLLLLLVGSSIAAEIDQRDQLRQTLAEVKTALSDGSISTHEAADRMLAALSQAEKSLSPLEVAATLDRVAPLLDDPEESLRLLERSYAIKEAETGPRSGEIADTLLLIASEQDAMHSLGHVAKRQAGHAVGDSDFTESRGYDTRLRALSTRVEVFGQSSCSAAEVRLLLAVSEDDDDKREKVFREVLTYCPPPLDMRSARSIALSEAHPGVWAFVALSSLLRDQGREVEREFNDY